MMKHMTNTVLVTGGTGYIGSHTVVQLLNRGERVVIIDNLSNSKRDAIDRVEQITSKRPEFVEADIRDREQIARVLKMHSVCSVIHFAGLKAVGESKSEPLNYYDHNVSGSLALLRAMQDVGCKSLVFSSSATVYGDAGVNKYSEDLPLSPINVYGRTKTIVEDMMRDLKASDDQWRIGILRYFNPVGAHESGLLGEDPLGKPNNLMPIIAQVASGRRKQLEIFGNDYPTPDGTGLRDYIHVDDLANGHLSALDWLRSNQSILTVNLGTGRSYSVLEVIRIFEKISGLKIPYVFSERRSGDLAEYFSDPSQAKKLLGWEAQKSVEQMCRDVWRWIQMNPKGLE